jgi:hypothetical protein
VSAVGVLLYQMGLAGFAVWLSYGVIALRAWRGYGETRQPLFAILAFGILTVAMNGLLQEEALFSPLAMGPLMALAGLAFGARRWAETSRGSLADMEPPTLPLARARRGQAGHRQHGAEPA